MITLTTDDIIEIVLGGAVTTNELSCTANHIDTADDTPLNSAVSSNGGTDVTLVSAPASGLRQVYSIAIYNTDTVSATVTVKMKKTATDYILVVQALATGESLCYEHGKGWYVASSSVEAGDMLKSVYDPTTVGGDAFDMDNMVEGADAKVLTGAERTLLGNTTNTNSGDQTISDATISITDIATNNVSPSAHGFAPKGDDSATSFLNGKGLYSTPAGGGNVSTSGTPVDNDFAKFVSATDIEGRSYSEVRTDLNIADGATANSADATLLARANHTGTQVAATISDFDTEVANNSAVTANTAKVTNFTHTGDVTGNEALTIGANKVSDSMLAVAVQNEMAANTAKVTNADHTGDVTGAGALTIGNDKVTYAKMQNVSATSRIMGRVTASAGDMEELTAAQVKTLLAIPFEMEIAVSDEATALTTGTAKVTFRMPCAITLTAVRASVNTAPTGATLNVDINESGSSILSTVITIDASEKTSTTAATAPVISDSSLADDAEMKIDIDQIGSTIAGKGLKITLIGTRA